MLAEAADPGVVKSAMVFGATGFILKSTCIETILQGIRDALAGEVTLPYGLQLPRNSVATAELMTLANKLRLLTPQQFSVLQLLCQGQLDGQIGRELHVRETIVRAHMTQVLRKLGAGSRMHAVGEVSRLSLSAVRALYTSQSASGSRKALH